MGFMTTFGTPGFVIVMADEGIVCPGSILMIPASKRMLFWVSIFSGGRSDHLDSFLRDWGLGTGSEENLEARSRERERECLGCLCLCLREEERERERLFLGIGVMGGFYNS